MNKSLIKIFILIMPLISSAQGALDILDRAQSSADRSWGNTLNNAQTATENRQIDQESAWFNRCMYQTGGDVARCQGIRQTRPTVRQHENDSLGYSATLIQKGQQVRTVTGEWAMQCVYDFQGRRFMRLYEDCPYSVRVR